MARVVLVAIPPLNTRFPALNIALLTGELKANGHVVKAFDFNIEAFTAIRKTAEYLWDFRNGQLWNDPNYFEETIYGKHIAPLFPEWMERILAEEPEFVGVSVTQNSLATRIAKAVKAHNPKIKVIFGGPMCSQTMGDHTYQPNEFVDVVVSDEGERTLLDIIENYERSETLPLLPGLSILKDGIPVFGGGRTAIAKLDTTAFPDFTDLNLELYTDVYYSVPAWELPIYTSRGCVGRCNFCMDYKMWSVYYRQKSPERVVAEMEHFYEKYGVNNFIFIELVFNGHHEWIQKFCDILIAKKHNFRFWSHGRVDGRLAPELLKSLRAAGFWHFIFGMESASDKVLKLMRKGTTKAKAAANLLDCHNADIAVSVNVILGYPGETFRDFWETVVFVVKYRRYLNAAPNITTCYVTPGTDLYLYPEKFGIIFDRHSPQSFQDWSTVDGKNTLAVRLRRRRILEFICRQVVFKSESATPYQLRYYTDRLFGYLAQLFDREDKSGGSSRMAPLIVRSET